MIQRARLPKGIRRVPSMKKPLFQEDSSSPEPNSLAIKSRDGDVADRVEKPPPSPTPSPSSSSRARKAPFSKPPVAIHSSQPPTSSIPVPNSSFSPSPKQKHNNQKALADTRTNKSEGPKEAAANAPESMTRPMIYRKVNLASQRAHTGKMRQSKQPVPTNVFGSSPTPAASISNFSSPPTQASHSQDPSSEATHSNATSQSSRKSRAEEDLPEGWEQVA